jgi:hypothetical protein
LALIASASSGSEVRLLMEGALVQAG